jgi:hypothetical protein
LLEQFEALAHGKRAALPDARWGPDGATFEKGYRQFCSAHLELSRTELSAHARLLRLGTRLWAEGRRDHDAEEGETTENGRRAAPWTPELVRTSLERLALRGALARRRAIWLTRLVDATLVWREPGSAGARVIVIENGQIALRAAIQSGVTPPVPPGFRRPVGARREALTTPACFDRLRVLTSELKRLAAAGAPVALRLNDGRPLADARLASALSWV